ncbi:MAG: diaminopimelate decarboxylase [Christensenellaceae bacterium]|jgi:diaminopimelate decarboxylase|nr:diaminopimelate decarboxylase [Christensenellaceae bacterium]
MAKKECFLSLEKAKEIAAEFPTPLHVYDEGGIKANAQRLNAAFSWNKGYKEYFAVKANPNPEILKILKKEGCGADCSSYTELLLADALGFKGDEIMFSSNETADKEFVLARELGAIINLDDITHIEFLKRACRANGFPKKICLRFNPGGDFVINNLIMGSPSTAKYGLTRAQLSEAVKTLKALGVKEFGLHSFLASNTTGNSYYPALAKLMFKTVAELEAEAGVKFVFVNLSGGVGIAYREDQEAPDIREVAKGVQAAYAEVFGKNDSVAVYTELGRFMLAPYGGLLTKVIHFKHIYREYAGVDACAAHLMRPAIYGAYHHITVLGKENEANGTVYDIVGSLCENSDKFAENRPLPALDYGDLLFIHDAGAHGHSMGYNYNGKLRSAEVLMQEDGNLKLIRRAETEKDYFATVADIYPELGKLK